jgi:predicted amidohydrolase YtcJ
MSNIQQRLSLLTAALLASCGLSAAEAPSAADLIFVNAAIHTVDEKQPVARWLAVRGGRIEAMGMAQPTPALVGPKTRMIDAHGKLLLPGFIDAHTHPIWGGLSYSRCPLYDGNSIADYQRLIKKCAAEDKEATWLYGTGWRDGVFVPTGIPTKAQLDAAVHDRPAVFSNVGGHGLWLNSKALEAAGITRDTPDPPHGRIDRDANGDPIGGLQESAVELVAAKIPPPTASAREKALLYAIHYFNSIGIVGFHDALVPIRGKDPAQVIPPGVPETYALLQKKGELKAYVTVALAWDRNAGVEQVAGILAAEKSLSAVGIHARTVKFLLDGVLVQRTAALLEPYSDAPNEKGALEVDPATLNAGVTALDREGFQIHVHAIGDAAVHAALDAFEKAHTANHSTLNRPLISHLNIISPADYGRFRSLGVTPIFQPLWTSLDDYMVLTAVRVGPARMQHMYPVASLMRGGTSAAYGSDWPVASANPFEGIEVAITHRAPGVATGEQLSPTERVTLDEAVRNYTVHSAYALHIEDQSGSLTVGKNADLVALDQNIYEVPTTAIGRTHVLVTMYKGEVVYGDLGKL